MSYVTTRPVESAVVATIENLLPRHARSVMCLHGDLDADPVRYKAHVSEIHHVRRAIRQARAEAGLRALEAAARVRA